MLMCRLLVIQIILPSRFLTGHACTVLEICWHSESVDTKFSLGHASLFQLTPGNRVTEDHIDVCRLCTFMRHFWFSVSNIFFKSVFDVEVA